MTDQELQALTAQELQAYREQKTLELILKMVQQGRRLGNDNPIYYGYPIITPPSRDAQFFSNLNAQLAQLSRALPRARNNRDVVGIVSPLKR